MGVVNAFKNLVYIAIDKIRNGYIRVRDKLTAFYQKALSMMKVITDKLTMRVRGVILGSAHFVRRIGNKYQEGTKNYSLDKELGEWNETTVVREIPMEDIPPQYRTMDEEFEIDDTLELEASIE